MRLAKRTLFCLASEARCTLQVPQYTIGEYPPGEPMIDAPDDWFDLLRNKGLSKWLVPAKRSGFTFFSRKGYEALKDELCDAFARANATIVRYPGLSHQEAKDLFAAEAEKHFQCVKP